MRNIIRTLHLSVALVAATFVVILGVTGSIMAFEPELDHVLHRSLWHVDPQGQPLSLEQLAAKIQTAYPGEAISHFYVSGAPVDRSPEPGSDQAAANPCTRSSCIG